MWFSLIHLSDTQKTSLKSRKGRRGHAEKHFQINLAALCFDKIGLIQLQEKKGTL